MRAFPVRAVLLGILISVLPSSFAQQPVKPDFTGSWLFTWDNDSKNSNLATLKHQAGTITGTYINDSKEKCPVVGRLDADGANVTLTITCPGWDIKCDGSIKNPKLAEGRYLAYGDTSGNFQMSRQ